MARQSKLRRAGKIMGTAAALLLFYALILRPRHQRWGASDDEIGEPLPGDELADHVSANHAITIQAPIETVWSWLVQIGQDRGGFYSYSWLENLIRADIHNADHIVPEWQELEVGDHIRLASKEVYGDVTLLPVTSLDPPHHLVLKGWGAFVLRRMGDGATRMLIRSHGPKVGSVGRVLQFLFFEPIHFIMERKMLLGIRQRAEATAVADK